MTTYRYEFVVEEADDGSCVARLDGESLTGYGATPLLACAELVKAIIDWGEGGSDRWLNQSEEGRKLAAMFGVVLPPIKESGPS